MHCVALYPTPPEAANLRAIETLRRPSGCRSSLSDHSREQDGHRPARGGPGRGRAGKALHPRPGLPGYDHAMSETPESLTRIVGALRQVPNILGHGCLERSEAELARRETARRGSRTGDFAPGEGSPAHLIPLRPSHAVAPCALPELLGKTLVSGRSRAAPPWPRTDLHAARGRRRCGCCSGSTLAASSAAATRGPAEGLGHATRCLALAEALREQAPAAEIRFALRGPGAGFDIVSGSASPASIEREADR